MSDIDSEVNEGNPMEVLLQKHKKEKKELQSKIQSLKKSATKGDKKKKKEVQEEISKLESELVKKHEEEIFKLKSELNEKEEKETQKSSNEVEKSENDELIEKIETVQISSQKQASKVTRAQKRRDKKAAELREREENILQQEVENETGLRNVETEKIKKELKNRGLMIFDIKADGNCLYNAVDHQLKSKTKSSYGVKQLRLETSNHIRKNSSDYLPFLSNPTTGEMMTDEEFNDYCSNIANTTNWGGQIELRALSHVIKKPITVIQADGPPLIMGEEYNDGSDSLIISYHRHMYRLGEHYNSVQPYAEDDF